MKGRPKGGAFEYLGVALALLRGKAGMSQAELAAASGVTKGQISKFEREETTPAIGSIEKLLAALGIGARELVDALEEARRAGVERQGRVSPREEVERAALVEVREGLRQTTEGFERYLEALASDRGRNGG